MEAQGICSLEFVPQADARLPEFSAGAHIDVHVSSFVRQYSLCNKPGERHRYVVAVLKEPASRGGSTAMHDLAEGQQIFISVPRNQFVLAAGAHHSLLVAGGIGITPILSMAQALQTAGSPMMLHYCTRSRHRAAFTGWLETLGLKPCLRLHHDEGSDDQKFDARVVLSQSAPGTHLYVCGPAGFMEYVIGAAKDAGWPPERIHYEHFSAPVAAAAAAGEDSAFEVCIASTGLRYVVPAGVSITCALQEHGVDIPVSCEQGVCGTCLTGLLKGEPDHRDFFLTDEEHASNDCITPCCSRARSASLTLDL